MEDTVGRSGLEQGEDARSVRRQVEPRYSRQMLYKGPWAVKLPWNWNRGNQAQFWRVDVVVLHKRQYASP